MIGASLYHSTHSPTHLAHRKSLSKNAKKARVSAMEYIKNIKKNLHI